MPQQREVRVLPGETALAFYTATNKSSEDIIGVATYSVTPAQVAPYFSKIQCFCFEEQRLNAGETVDMPVFFFIDPDFVNDPTMTKIDTITLSYTFFSKTTPLFLGLTVWIELIPFVRSPIRQEWEPNANADDHGMNPRRIPCCVRSNGIRIAPKAYHPTILGSRSYIPEKPPKHFTSNARRQCLRVGQNDTTILTIVRGKLA